MSAPYIIVRLIKLLSDNIENYILSKELLFIFVSVLSGFIAEKLMRRRKFEKWGVSQLLWYSGLTVIILIAILLLIVIILTPIYFLAGYLSPEVTFVW